MKKIENLWSFNDFDKNWKSKDFKKTKRTDVGIDIFEQKDFDSDELEQDELNDIVENDDETGYEYEEGIDTDQDFDDDELEDGDDELEDGDDELEDDDWKTELSTLIEDIIERGVDPDDIFDYIENIEDLGEVDEEDIDDESELDDDDEDFDDDEFEDDDLGSENIEEEDSEDEQEDNDEIQESIKKFRFKK